MDRVQLLKQESAELGGDAADSVPYPDPIAPQQDAIEAAGVYMQDASNRDESTLISRSGDDLLFRDGNNPVAVTLTKALETGDDHPALRQLIHFIDEGPAEGFASGALREVTPAGLFPTSIVWYEDVASGQKIVSLDITWANLLISELVWKAYDTDGSTVLATVTDTITRSGIFESSRVRTIA